MAKEGDRLTLRIADQAIVLQARHAALQTVRALVRQPIPEGESLVDALITPQRQEAQADDRAAQHTPECLSRRNPNLSAISYSKKILHQKNQGHGIPAL
ncbi:hypothetical protein [Acidithiobacillus sp.]